MISKLLTFLFLACAPDEPEDDSYLPGSWTAENVYREHFGLIEIDSNIGIQLYMINETNVNGYIYHDEGTVLIQGEYYLEPCVSYQLTGQVEHWAGGFKTNCMTVHLGLNLICAEMYVAGETLEEGDAFIEFKLLGAHFDTIIFDNYHSNQNVKNYNLPICY